MLTTRVFAATAGVLLFPLCAAAQGATAPAGHDAIMAPITAFFAAAARQDTAAMSAAMHQDARVTLLRPAQGGGSRVVVIAGRDFVAQLARPGQPPLDEPVRNPVIQVDGDLATVWVEYQVRVNGAVSNCGHDAFHVVRTDGAWRILNVSDTFRRDNCGPIWPTDG
jgi:ketosteroid isomerase-like protein